MSRGLLLLPLAALALAACGGPEVLEPKTIRFEGEDYKPGAEQVADVHFEVDPEVDGDLEIDELTGAIRDGRLSAQFRMRNEDDVPLRLTVTWNWRDADGVALRDSSSPKGEHSLVLRPGEERLFTRTSPRPGAIQIYCRVVGGP